ncbi:MAG: hypothetical protein M3Z33_11470 [Actinomycetota bacterium]|nr:hypothetical protein [Actinomycetota bacterium]
MRRLVGRGALGSVGVFLAAAMAGVAVTVAVSLASGFDRTADRADLPDVIARFDRHDAADVLRRARALPNVEHATARFKVDRLRLAAGGHRTRNASLDLVEPGRRGYAILSGRDVRDGASDEVVVEQGVSRAWHVGAGDTVEVGEFQMRIVGVSLTPDNVAFPLATVPRFAASGPGIRKLFGRGQAPAATELLLWVHDRSRLDVTLGQARATSAGLAGLRILTRGGVRVLIDGAAGIVVALMAAFSIVALGSAGIMLAASAQSAVRRRLPALGVLRAAGATRTTLAKWEAGAAARRAAFPALLGTAAGWLVVNGPVGSLLATLNQIGPGWELLPWLAASCGLVVAVVTAASAWPAWRATRGPTAGLLRGAELSPKRAGRSAAPNVALLGARAMAARRVRLGLSAAVVASAVSVVLLLLGMASLLSGLRDDPGSLGRRYQLTAEFPQDRVDEVAGIPGVRAVAPRYAVEAADSFRLGETVRVIAFPGDHTRFESPQLAAGHRLRGPREAEVGAGLADVLGLAPGSILALQLPSGREARFRVSGIVRSLEGDGRVAYVQPPELLRAAPELTPALAIRLTDTGRTPTVTRALQRIGAVVTPTGAATSGNGSLLSTLSAVLRVVAGVNGLVCLYAIVAALALVAGERRSLVALLRSGGARRCDVALVFGGAAVLLVMLAIPVALLAERFAVGPLVAHLAAGYASLQVTPSVIQTSLVILGLLLFAALASLLTARRALATPVVSGLREPE